MIEFQPFNSRLLLPIKEIIKNLPGGYFTTDSRLNIARAPFEGIPENKTMIMDLNTRWVLGIDDSKDIGAMITDGATFVEISQEGIRGGAMMISRATDFLQRIYRGLEGEQIRGDKDVFEMLENYKRNPDTAKNPQTIYNDWVNQNVSELFSKKTGEVDRLANLENFLSNMIGMDEMKDTLRRFLAILEFAEKTKDKFTIDKPNLHMVFKGNAGTGKTMLANMLVTLYGELGLLTPENADGSLKMTSINGAGLLTDEAPTKVRTLCDRAMGGILLIDEAYAFTESSKGIGDEIIAALLTEMEDRKEGLAIVFAGYTDKMDKFLKFNPGLRSRVGANIFLRDYTAGELLDMINRKFEASGFKVTQEAIENMYNVFKEAVRYRDFGNGRFVARFYQDIVSEHAFKVKGMTDINALGTIQAHDVTRNVIQLVLKGSQVA